MAYICFSLFIVQVKSYLYRQWKRILSGRVSLQDFVFAKEVRLGTYSTRDSSLLPPAAIVATKSMRADSRTEPRYAERVPYVVIHGEPGARLVDMVVDPLVLLDIDTPYRLNDLYYINKQIIPALQRVFGLVGADLNQWFLEMPRATRSSLGQRPLNSSNSHKTRIDYFYLSKHCILCGEVVQESAQLCNRCLKNKNAAAATMVWKTSKLEREMQHLATVSTPKYDIYMNCLRIMVSLTTMILQSLLSKGWGESCFIKTCTLFVVTICCI